MKQLHEPMEHDQRYQRVQTHQQAQPVSTPIDLSQGPQLIHLAANISQPGVSLIYLLTTKHDRS